MGEISVIGDLDVELGECFKVEKCNCGEMEG